ncbi:hypothetical protein [Collimonas fungivorans]|uniref:hypothetical protein n=1 Tax=Collimonas fungivorans TaxID=158899 RepID=UPI001237412C|nr:hypothetical protein [Collimonas fungivorans]
MAKSTCRRIRILPPEIEDRLIPYHRKDEQIKGAGNRSSVRTPVERTIGFVVLSKMDNTTIKAVVDSFPAVFNRDTQDQDLRSRPRDTRPPNPPNTLASKSISSIRVALGDEDQMEKQKIIFMSLSIYQANSGYSICY